MNEHDAVLETIRGQAARDDVRVTPHAQQEMVEEGISMDDLLLAIANGQVLENYPQHRRAPAAFCTERMFPDATFT